MDKNRLYYGDNLEILQQAEYFPDECVDLIYLDPPFNSSRNYNVLFADQTGKESEAQITAFEDTWEWGPTAQDTYEDLIINAPHGVDTRHASPAYPHRPLPHARLPRHDGRPPRRTPPRTKAHRQPLFALRPPPPATT